MPPSDPLTPNTDRLLTPWTMLHGVAERNKAIAYHERKLKEHQAYIDGVRQIKRPSRLARDNVAVRLAVMRVHQKCIEQLEAIFPNGIGDL